MSVTSAVQDLQSCADVVVHSGVFLLRATTAVLQPDANVKESATVLSGTCLLRSRQDAQNLTTSELFTGEGSPHRRI